MALRNINNTREVLLDFIDSCSNDQRFSSCRVVLFMASQEQRVLIDKVPFQFQVIRSNIWLHGLLINPLNREIVLVPCCVVHGMYIAKGGYLMASALFSSNKR